MKPSEAAMLLGVASAYDRRTVGQADAEAWAAALGGLDLNDCRQAIIDHYADSTEWLMPAHIKRAVRRIRGKRCADYGTLPLPPARIREMEDGPEFHAAYSQWERESWDHIAAGREPEGDVLPEIEAPKDSAETLKEIRREIERRRIEDTSGTEPDEEDPTPDERPAA